MSMRRRGFTLIELLVVIAIIGILAAMLFPVFARARESARKTQCLANVKNLAIAINMYTADWDKGFPTETDKGVIAFFNTGPGGRTGSLDGEPWGTGHNCNRPPQANPYLREAVILEDYAKSRDIYRCPSAKISNGAAFIVPMGRAGFWPNNYADNTDWQTSHDVGPCYVAWPNGWGGDVTDSFQQGLAQIGYGSNGAGNSGAGVFVQGIGFNGNLTGLNLSSIQDAGRWVALGDTGKQVGIWEMEGIAYPDTCQFNGCGNSSSCPAPICAAADWANCSWTQDCGVTYDAGVEAMNDASIRKGMTRHMGGSNVGFMDGHAKWYLADALVTQAEPFPDPIFEGICSCWPGRPGY